MDTTIRDGQQSLWATRMQLGDMLPVLPKMDKVGYWAIEAWGGATFDSCLRFLDENPLGAPALPIKANTPNTPLAMLSPRAEPRGVQALLARHSVPVHRGRAPQRHRGLPRVRRAERHPQRHRQRRGHKKLRRPLRGRHLLHHIPGAHARQLPRVRAAAEGARGRQHRHQGHGGHAHALPHRAHGEGVQRRKSACRCTSTATTWAAWPRPTSSRPRRPAQP